MTLGAIISTAFAMIAAIRPVLVKRWLMTIPLTHQPKRQFVLDVGLVLAAGVLVAVYNFIVYEFPLASAVSLLIGCLMTGVFLAVDVALALERKIIGDVAVRKDSLPIPKRFFSVTRKFSLVAGTLALFVWVIIVLVISRDIVWISQIEPTPEALIEAQLSIAYEIFFIMAVLLSMTLNLIISYSKNLKLLFENETSVLQRVSRGDLDGWVPVATNDEFGLIAGHTNQMIDGLRHRLKLISALKLAEEVQQNLLPQNPPDFPRTDIAATSIYCEETGGDYYDFLPLSNGHLGIVVADAADHGIGAAMQMTTARAFIIYGARHYDNASDLLTDVNRDLVNDSRGTGRFVALMFVEIDPDTACLRWIRAGHEPALLFDPQQDRFRQLDGDGMVLGIDENARFNSDQTVQWTPGSVLFLGTDGIHETTNQSGQVFGRRRLQDLIRAHHTQSAETIQNAILSEVETFRGDASQQDDITLVVVKLL